MKRTLLFLLSLIGVAGMSFAQVITMPQMGKPISGNYPITAPKITNSKLNANRQAIVPLAVGETQANGTFKEETITFMGESRKLSLYIPSDYDPEIPANLMIALHGLGADFSYYRTELTYAFPEADMPNTIIICPDGGGDPAKDFYAPKGDEEVIQAAIDFAKQNYNIDENEIILQGFSLGGRSALIYGLDNPSKFKALLLNTPAIQGCKEARIPYEEGGFFQYANASEITIYLTWGGEDYFYVSPINEMVNQLIKNNCKLYPKHMPEMGHTIPYMSQMTNYHAFISPECIFPEYSLAIIDYNTFPKYSSSSTEYIHVLAQNFGSETLTKIEFNVEVDGDESTYEWTGNMPQFHHAEIKIPIPDKAHGRYVVTFHDTYLNGYEAESPSTCRIVYVVQTNPEQLPYTETFEEDFEWLLKSHGDYMMPWSLALGGLNESKRFLHTLNSIDKQDNSGTREEIAAPLMDLTSIKNPTLTFDLAYSYLLYTATDGTDYIEIPFADTLEIMISTDLGETYTTIFSKGGEELMTFKEPLKDNTIEQIYNTKPGTNEWRRMGVELADYAAYDKVIIKFSYLSALGGLVCLDNVAFSDETVSLKPAESLSTMSVYPNPVTDKLIIQSEEHKINTVNVYDAAGKKIMENRFNNESWVTIQTSSLHNGLYLVEIITSNNEREIQKISVNK